MNTNVTMVFNSAASQLQGCQFKPELGLLSLWRVSPSSHWFHPGSPVSSHCPKHEDEDYEDLYTTETDQDFEAIFSKYSCFSKILSQILVSKNLHNLFSTEYPKIQPFTHCDSLKLLSWEELSSCFIEL